jgi:hypothetical protein
MKKLLLVLFAVFFLFACGGGGGGGGGNNAPTDNGTAPVVNNYQLYAVSQTCFNQNANDVVKMYQNCASNSLSPVNNVYDVTGVYAVLAVFNVTDPDLDITNLNVSDYSEKNGAYTLTNGPVAYVLPTPQPASTVTYYTAWLFNQVEGNYMDEWWFSDKKGNTSTAVFSYFVITENPCKTHLSGIIYNSTEMTLDNSPYCIDSEVDLAPGITINVDAGVEIRTNGYGAYLIGNQSDPTSVVVNLNGTADRPIILKGKIQSYGALSLGFATVHALHANATSVTIQSCGGWIKNSLIISGELIADTTINQYFTEISQNIFKDSRLYGASVVRNNSFYNTNPWQWYGSTEGLYLLSGIDCQYNTFVSYTSYPIVFAPEYENVTIAIPNNFWNTTDTSVIDGMISDSHDSVYIEGTVEYEPILTASDPNTPLLDANSLN